MMSFFAAIWKGITSVAAALTPFRKGGGLAPVVRWTIWLILYVGLMALLIGAYHYFELKAVSQWGVGLPSWTWQFYLPVLATLIILLLVIFYWFYLLLFAPPDDSPFPDIDAAWNEAVDALAAARIHLPQVPVFLVIGRPAADESHLFDASGARLVVRQTPADPNAPVHVYAEQQAVYITCRGASVLGELAGILAMEKTQESIIDVEGDFEDDALKTSRPGSKHLIIIEELRSLGREPTALRRRMMRRLALNKPLGSDFMSDANEVARLRDRLAHLCRLINRDRQPWCALNGVLLLIPMAGSDSAGEAQLTAQACEEDLGTLRDEIKIDCPLVTLLVDLEELPGAADFIKHQSAREMKSRRGSGFPVATRLSREGLLDQIRISINWACTTYLQDSVYKGAFKLETAAEPDLSGPVAANGRLVLFLDQMNERAPAITSIILQAIAPEHESLFRYAGFYMAATGGDKSKQAFAAGILEKMVREQNAVTWTEAAKAEDARCRTLANYYAVAACVLFAAWCGCVGIGIYLWFFRNS